MDAHSALNRKGEAVLTSIDSSSVCPSSGASHHAPLHARSARPARRRSRPGRLPRPLSAALPLVAVGAGVLAPAATSGPNPDRVPNVELHARNAAATTPAVPSPATSTPGAVGGFGGAPVLGAPGAHLSAPVVGIARTPSGTGYWVVGADGGVFAYGTAAFYGSLGNAHLNQPIVGIASTPTGRGYWLVASDGGIFTFGDARYFGSLGNVHLNRPIVGIASSPTGGGYWLAASDGGVFTFGDARFHGSLGDVHLNMPIVGVAATGTGGGYWLAASDGGVFTFGDARFHGSLGGEHLNGPIIGIAPSPTGGGYWLAASDGGVFSFGDALYNGSLAPEPSSTVVSAVAAGPSDSSYWLATAPAPPPPPPPPPPPAPAVQVQAVSTSGQALGSFVVTCYDLTGRTASGVPTSMATVAVDPSVIPLGSTINIAGVGDRVAQDTGGAIIGHRLDLWLPTYADCVSWGVQTRSVTLVN